MNVAIIGAGPAGLRAAEVAAGLGASVTIFDAKPSPGRKFLVAGRGGLNLASDETVESLASRYSTATGGSLPWSHLLSEFDVPALRAWAASLGVETFVASTRRIYPVALKAAPLLRAWIRRLKDSGVGFEMRHRLEAITPGAPLHLEFSTATGKRTISSGAVILAMGGGSWPETGSDGTWVETLMKLRVHISPLKPANCGWECSWPASVLAHEGHPCKNLVVTAGGATAAGELLLTSYGLEGGAIYKLGPALREMEQPAMHIDFKPDTSIERLAAKMGTARHPLLPMARSRWKLNDAAFAILESQASASDLDSVESLARKVKNCQIKLTGPRPLAEAISSAGGVPCGELDDTLMFKCIPGLFAAGEMVDWEAPTGGYLIHGCLATGGRAGAGAAAYARQML